jgi:hypothetical protein
MRTTSLMRGQGEKGGHFSRNGHCRIAVVVVGGGNGGAWRALLVQGRGRTSIVTCCHRDNDNDGDKLVAMTTTRTPLLVAMALSATQNNNQQTKGANKRRDSDDGVGQ